MVGPRSLIYNHAQLWDIVEDKKLFGDIYCVSTDEYDEVGLLAHITALLGPAPKGLLDRGKRTHLFYEPSGESHDSFTRLPLIGCPQGSAKLESRRLSISTICLFACMVRTRRCLSGLSDGWSDGSRKSGVLLRNCSKILGFPRSLERIEASRLYSEVLVVRCRINQITCTRMPALMTQISTSVA